MSCPNGDCRTNHGATVSSLNRKELSHKFRSVVLYRLVLLASNNIFDRRTANLLKVYLNYFRLSDLYQFYGGNTREVQSTTGEDNKTTSRYGKTGDIYSLVSLDVIKAPRQLQQKRRLTIGLMSRTMAVPVRCTFQILRCLNVNRAANLFYLYFEFNGVFHI